jgi:hypothetical protein
MRARGMAARLKVTPKSQVAEAKGLERRRGLISFLTWAFFLADMLGRDGISPSVAQASDADEPAPPHGGPDTTPPLNELSDRPLTSIGDAGEPITLVSPGYTLSLSPLSSGAGASDVGGGSPAAQTASRAATVETGGAEMGGTATVGLPPDISEATPQDGAQPADAASFLAVTVTPDGLLHGVADTLGAVPVVGDLLGSTVHAVASTVGSLVDGLGGLLAPSGGSTASPAEAVLASDGAIEFDAGSSQAPLNEIETPHGFTDYGIALELNLSGGAPLHLTALAPPAEPFADLIGFETDRDASHLAASADAGLPDEVGHRSSADVLA